jgi:Protein of unknown function (DUF3306)
MAEDEGFVARWARLKREARERQPVPADEQAAEQAEVLPSAAEQAPVAPTGEAHPPEPKPGEDLPFDPASLPDLESLTYESDYTPFLQKGVPVELRNQALRRLWRSSPVLANLDGLLEYGKDYSGVGTKKTLVRTAYRVGRGMIERALEEAEHKPKAPAPSAAAGDAPPAQERIEADHAAEAEPAFPTAEPEPARPEAEEPETEGGARPAKT